MKFCPKCRNRYNDELKVCVVDGTTLHLSDSEAPTLQNAPLYKPYLFLKTYILGLGDYADISTPHSKLKITLSDIVEKQFPNGLVAEYLTPPEPAAKLSCSMHGIFYGGPSTIKSGINEYIVPVAMNEHSEGRALYSFYLTPELIVLFRIFVMHINTHTKKIEFNIGYFRFGEEDASHSIF